MERLTRPNINVDPGTDRFLHAVIGGKEIDWTQCRDSTLNVLINGPTSNGFGKDIFRKMARDLYGRLKAYEDIAELCGGFDRLRELAEADKDGRVVVLPCKVGDTVFARLDNKSKYVCECKVKQIVVGNIGFVTFAPIGAPEREYDVSLRGFGKTVFLSREEAERAMEGKKDGNETSM